MGNIVRCDGWRVRVTTVCHVNAILLSLFVVGIYMYIFIYLFIYLYIYVYICSVNNVVNIEGITTHCYQHFGTSVHLRINCLIFLSDRRQIWIFCRDFKRIALYKISLKSVHWYPSGFMRTDGET